MIFVFSLLTIGAGCVIEGLVIQKLWHWFIVSGFGVAEIRLPHAIGVSLLVGLMAKQASSGQQEKDQQKLASAVVSHLFIRPLVVLAIGWIASLFI